MINRTAARIAWVLAVMVSAAPGSGRAAGPGAAGGDFQRAGWGARAAALADTQAALADDVFALDWNPAGLGVLRGPEAAFTNSRGVAGVEQQAAAVSLPLRAVGTVAAGFERWSVEAFPGFDARGTPTGDLTAGVLDGSVGWGRNLFAVAPAPGGLFVGLTARYHRETHAGVSASAPSMNGGVLLRPWGASTRGRAWLERVTVGAAVRRLGPGLRFDADTAPSPSALVVGTGYSQAIAGDLLTVGADWHAPAKEDAHPSVGAEYSHRDFLIFRAGWSGRAARAGGVRAGGGIRIRGLRIDYAWSGLADDLGAAHRVSVLFRFGATPTETESSYRRWMEEGRKNEEAGLDDRAVLAYEEALRRRPRDPEALERLLRCGERLKAAP